MWWTMKKTSGKHLHWGRLPNNEGPALPSQPCWYGHIALAYCLLPGRPGESASGSPLLTSAEERRSLACFCQVSSGLLSAIGFSEGILGPFVCGSNPLISLAPNVWVLAWRSWQVSIYILAPVSVLWATEGWDRKHEVSITVWVAWEPPRWRSEELCLFLFLFCLLSFEPPRAVNGTSDEITCIPSSLWPASVLVVLTLRYCRWLELESELSPYIFLKMDELIKNNLIVAF